MSNTPNIYQRVLAVAAAVGGVEATGKNQYGVKAVSIEDTEDAIREALASNGVVTRWSYEELVDLGNGKNWLAKLRVKFVNPDSPEDTFEDFWQDTGGSPAAAVSFARKGYYKSLFHLATAEEENEKSTRETSHEQRHYTRGQQPRRPSAPAPEKPKPIEEQDVKATNLFGQQQEAPQEEAPSDLSARLRARIDEYSGLTGKSVPTVVKSIKQKYSLDAAVLGDAPPQTQQKIIDELEEAIARAQIAEAK